MQQQKEKASYQYTAAFCEENIYLLVQEMSKEPAEGLVQWYVVFLTNAFQQTHIKCQKSSKDGLVVWDYHVILVKKVTLKKDNKLTSQSFVYDFDTTLPWGCSFEEYFSKAINFKKPSASLNTMFRVCDGKKYLLVFASDRSHMVKNGKYISPPPKYPPIRSPNAQSKHNLEEFLDLGNQSRGVWLDEAKVFDYFREKSV